MPSHDEGCVKILAFQFPTMEKEFLIISQASAVNSISCSCHRIFLSSHAPCVQFGASGLMSLVQPTRWGCAASSCNNPQGHRWNYAIYSAVSIMLHSTVRSGASCSAHVPELFVASQQRCARQNNNIPLLEYRPCRAPKGSDGHISRPRPSPICCVKSRSRIISSPRRLPPYRVMTASQLFLFQAT